MRRVVHAGVLIAAMRPGRLHGHLLPLGARTKRRLVGNSNGEAVVAIVRVEQREDVVARGSMGLPGRSADDTFRDAGKVGVWTKADSVTYFDALTATPLD